MLASSLRWMWGGVGEGLGAREECGMTPLSPISWGCITAARKTFQPLLDKLVTMEILSCPPGGACSEESSVFPGHGSVD
jgi:hypothetical protein